jgi:hypothetical protein
MLLEQLQLSPVLYEHPASSIELQPAMGGGGVEGHVDMQAEVDMQSSMSMSRTVVELWQTVLGVRPMSVQPPFTQHWHWVVSQLRLYWLLAASIAMSWQLVREIGPWRNEQGLMLGFVAHICVV